MEKEVPELLRSLVGDVIPPEYNTLVTVIVMLIAIYGISKAMDRIFPERGKGHITATDADLPAISTEFHQNVRIIFHAMDRDRKRLGWAGHVPSLFDERIPMHLEKALEPSSIFGKNEVKGDILLTREEDKNGDMQPKEFLLIHVKDAGPKA